MKALKFFALAAIMAGCALTANAQDDKAQIEAITKAITANPAGAEEQVKELYKHNKKNTNILIGIGNAYLQAKDTLNAAKYAQYALKADKKCAPAYILLGDVEVMKDDGGAAAQMYEQAMYFDPKNPLGYIKYARIYRDRSPEEAVAKLDALRAVDPEYPVDAEVAHIYYISNKFGKAVENYDKVNRDKLDVDQLSEYAFASWLNQDFNKSLEVSQYGLTKFPRNASLNRIAFYSSTDLKNYENAEKYANALFTQSDSAKFQYLDHLYYGYADMGNKNYDHAIEAFNKALADKPDRADAYKQLSDAHKAKKEWDKALSHYQAYLEKNEKADASDMAGLASLYEDAADEAAGPDKLSYLEKADATYEKLISTYPHAAVYGNFRRAVLHLSKFDNGDVKKGGAEPYYRNLINLIEAKPAAEWTDTDKSRLKSAYEYIGAYKLYTDQPDFKQYWEKVYELDPENPNAKSVLGK